MDGPATSDGLYTNAINVKVNGDGSGNVSNGEYLYRVRVSQGGSVISEVVLTRSQSIYPQMIDGLVAGNVHTIEFDIVVQDSESAAGEYITCDTTDYTENQIFIAGGQGLTFSFQLPSTGTSVTAIDRS